jgi:hypothetical protein
MLRLLRTCAFFFAGILLTATGAARAADAFQYCKLYANEANTAYFSEVFSAPCDAGSSTDDGITYYRVCTNTAPAANFAAWVRRHHGAAPGATAHCRPDPTARMSLGLRTADELNTELSGGVRTLRVDWPSRSSVAPPPARDPVNAGELLAWCQSADDGERNRCRYFLNVVRTEGERGDRLCLPNQDLTERHIIALALILRMPSRASADSDWRETAFTAIAAGYRCPQGR